MRRLTLVRRPYVRPAGLQRRQPQADGRQHFRINRPWETHWRKASCREMNCPHELKGWVTVVPAMSAQAEYIRRESGRHFTEEQRDGNLVAFTFPPGQQCFNDHRLPLDKQEIFIHQANGGQRVHDRPTDWTEHFNETADKVKRRLERG